MRILKFSGKIRLLRNSHVSIMKNRANLKHSTPKKIDPIPDVFATEEEAGEFWDTHSTADYEEYLEPVEMTIDIRKRQYLIEIDEESFRTLFQHSKKTHTPVKRLASKILKEKLGAVA